MAAFKNLERFAREVDVDCVDPQLRNNPDLAKGLKEFEEAWCMGNEHLLPRQHLEDLI